MTPGGRVLRHVPGSRSHSPCAPWPWSPARPRTAPAATSTDAEPRRPRADRATSGTSGPSPGVTATSVTVGQVDDLSSPIPGLFKGAEDGTKAYFAYINSQGGVNGRRLILDAQDSTFQGGQVATATGTQIRTDFALVGGFSLLDSAEKPLIDIARVPDVGFSLSPGLSTDPYLYSPLPEPRELLPAQPLQVPEEEVSRRRSRRSGSSGRTPRLRRPRPRPRSRPP